MRESGSGGRGARQKIQPVFRSALVTYSRRQGDHSRSTQTAAASGAEAASGAPLGAAAVSRLISSFSSLPGLKYGTFFGGTSTLSPVFGLRPLRGSRRRSRKLPNPRSSIFSPRYSASMMLLNTVSTMTSECFFVRSDTRDTSSTSSALVMLPVFMVAPVGRDQLSAASSQLPVFGSWKPEAGSWKLGLMLE